MGNNNNTNYLMNRRNALMNALKQAARNCEAIRCENCDLLIRACENDFACVAGNPCWIMRHMQKVLGADNIAAYNGTSGTLPVQVNDTYVPPTIPSPYANEACGAPAQRLNDDELNNMSAEELRKLVIQLYLEHDELLDIIAANNLNVDDELKKQAHRELDDMIEAIEGELAVAANG